MLYNWFSKAEYVKNQGVIKVNIHPDLKPFLLNLKERFIKYSLKYALSMSSAYAIRIYELLVEYKKLGFRIFELSQLHDLLKVPKSLKKRFPDFKRKVLLIAKEEINEHTDLLVDFEEIKEGRKVVKIKFIIKDKNENKKKQIIDNSDKNRDKLEKILEACSRGLSE